LYLTAAAPAEKAGSPQRDAIETTAESLPEDARLRQLGSRPLLGGGASTPLSGSERIDSEIVRLVQRLFVFSRDGGPRSVVFSAVDRSTVLSRLCYRAGHILAAQVPGSVCVVDTNFRAPALHECFGTDNSRGFAEAMVSSGPITDYSFKAGANVFVVPAGVPTKDPSGLFASDRLSARMSELKTGFDYVLINAPELDCSADAVLFGKLTDGVVLVVEANSTRRQSVRIARDSLSEAGVCLLGAILSHHTLPGSVYRSL
jgi:Mrp family chromosome partitioning ATPase